MNNRFQDLINQRSSFYFENPFDIPKLNKKFTNELVADYAGYFRFYYIKLLQNFEGASINEAEYIVKKQVNKFYTDLQGSNHDEASIKKFIYSGTNFFALGIERIGYEESLSLIKMGCEHVIAACQVWLDIKNKT